MRRIFTIITFCLLFLAAKAQQDTLLFDSDMNLVKKREKATVCAVIKSQKKDKIFIDFYNLDGKLVRSSEYCKFNKRQTSGRILHGATRYKFHSSEQDSLFVYYNNNKRNGGAFFYYPDGKIKANVMFKNNLLEGLAKQYHENGNLKTLEIYESNRSKGGKSFASDSTEIPYVPFIEPAEYLAGEKNMNSVLAQSIQLTPQLIKELSDKRECNILIEITVNEIGEATSIRLLYSSHPRLDEEKAFGTFWEKTKGNICFTPGKINGEPVTSTIVTSLVVRVGAPKISKTIIRM